MEINQVLGEVKSCVEKASPQDLQDALSDLDRNSIWWLGDSQGNVTKPQLTFLHKTAQRGQRDKMSILLNDIKQRKPDKVYQIINCLHKTEGSTALFFAANNGYAKITGLLLAFGADPWKGNCPLKAAVTRNSLDALDCVKQLIEAMESSAPAPQTTLTNHTNETAILPMLADLCMSAAESRTPLVLEYLLTKYQTALIRESVPGSIDLGLKLAIKVGFENVSPRRISCLKHIINLLSPDFAKLCTPENGNDNPLDYIYTSAPELLMPVLEKCLIHDTQSENELKSIDFRPIVGYQNWKTRPDTNNCEGHNLLKIFKNPKFAEKGLQILLAPVVQIFLYQKWKTYKGLLWLNFLLQLFWIVIYTTYNFEVFGGVNCPEDDKDVHSGNMNATSTYGLRIIDAIILNNSSGLKSCEFNRCAASALAVSLLFYTIPFIFKELVQLSISGFFNYFNVVNICQWSLQMAVLVNLKPLIASTIGQWEYHLASITVFLAWILFVREFEKISFTDWGTLRRILMKVFGKTVKAILFFTPIMVAFVLGLRRYITKNGEFMFLPFGLIKTIVLLTGEIDYRDSFYMESGPELSASAVVGQFCILVSIIVIGISLINVLISIAVGDVYNLVQNEKALCLREMLEYTADWDKTIGGIQKRLPAILKWMIPEGRFCTEYDEHGYKEFLVKSYDDLPKHLRKQYVIFETAKTSCFSWLSNIFDSCKCWCRQNGPQAQVQNNRNIELGNVRNGAS